MDMWVLSVQDLGQESVEVVKKYAPGAKFLSGGVNREVVTVLNIRTLT